MYRGGSDDVSCDEADGAKDEAEADEAGADTESCASECGRLAAGGCCSTWRECGCCGVEACREYVLVDCVPMFPT